jgi:hypothetical protein
MATPKRGELDSSRLVHRATESHSMFGLIPEREESAQAFSVSSRQVRLRIPVVRVEGMEVIYVPTAVLNSGTEHS